MSESPIVINTIDQRSVNDDNIAATYTLYTNIEEALRPKESDVQDKNHTKGACWMKQRYLYLDPLIHKLLVPQPVPQRKLAKYPALRGGVKEYLVVDSSLIGPECQKAGVSFRSFAQARGKHKSTRDDCLINQPLQLWRHDKEAEKCNRIGHYFLKYYGSTCGPNSVTGSTLNMNFLGPLQYSISGDIRADFNGIIRVGTSLMIAQILVDVSCPIVTILTVTVINLGLSSATFRIRVADCGPGLPYSWSHLEGPSAYISPQASYKFTMRLPGPSRNTLEKPLYCSVEIVNFRRELVAVRRMKVQIMARCLCHWHCLCICIMSGGALPKARAMTCEHISANHMHVAGIQGVPFDQYGTEYLSLQYIVLDLFIFLFAIFLIMLILGIAKALIGLCCCTEVGAWGLDIFRRKPKHLCEYLEKKFKSRTVIFDSKGYPIHPDSRKRTVRTHSQPVQFILNVFFFLVYPYFALYKLMRRFICQGSFPDCDYLCNWENKITTREPSWTTSKKENEELQRLIEASEHDECHPLCGRSNKKRMRGAGYPDEDEVFRFSNITEEINTEKAIRLQLRRSHEALLEHGIDIFCKKSGTSLNTVVKQQRVNKKEISLAHNLIESMLETRVVYRKLKRSVGGALIGRNRQYCVRGYFLRGLIGLTFITPTPLVQHWQILATGGLKQLNPPKVLVSPEFTAEYKTDLDVLRSGELTLTPTVPCINSRTQSCYKNRIQ